MSFIKANYYVMPKIEKKTFSNRVILVFTAVETDAEQANQLKELKVVGTAVWLLIFLVKSSNYLAFHMCVCLPLQS